MVRELDTFPGQRQIRQHDFGKLFNGKVYELVRGEDFTCSVASMRRQIARAAGARGVRIKLRRSESEGKVWIQAET